MAEGGYGIVYQANWLNGNYWTKNVILKRFKNSQYSNKCFLNELKSNYHCYKLFGLIKPYGFTKDPKLDNYILVMQYASEGDLHKYLQKEFTEIDWKTKIIILEYISRGLFTIHDENFIHRDLHSGNILVDDRSYNMPCWDSDPKKRPSAGEISNMCLNWYRQSNQAAELKRKELINSKKLGPKFSEKPHPKAIYTSRPISSYISKCSSIFSKCSSINSSNDYTSIEVVLDIDIESKSKLLGTKRKIEELLNDNSYENNGKPKTLKLVPGFPH
ncbi:kinase-like domain-containing protein [Rhizophagus irregularis DAOM 181602=DAOM 197198]|nr:kinase-like domain-containing protein [Rhizophagus irregularis DAOM 181602=DAOM 197198]